MVNLLKSAFSERKKSQS